jgi:hypothetical protein
MEWPPNKLGDCFSYNVVLISPTLNDPAFTFPTLSFKVLVNLCPLPPGFSLA